MMDVGARRRFGLLIKLARLEARMTQVQLAQAMGVSVTAVSQWERGMKERYSRPEAMALEAAMGISDSRLLVALGFVAEPLGSDDWKLTPEQTAEVRRYIDWIRQRDQ